MDKVTDLVIVPQTAPLTEERFWLLWNAVQTPREHLMLLHAFGSILEPLYREESYMTDPSNREAFYKYGGIYRSFALKLAEAYYAIGLTAGGDKEACGEVRDTALMFAMQRCLYRYGSKNEGVTLLAEAKEDAERILWILASHGLGQSLSCFRQDAYRRVLHEFMAAIAHKAEHWMRGELHKLEYEWLQVVVAEEELKKLLQAHVSAIDGNVERENVLRNLGKALRQQYAPGKIMEEIFKGGYVHGQTLKKVMTLLSPIAARRGQTLEEFLGASDSTVVEG